MSNRTPVHSLSVPLPTASSRHDNVSKVTEKARRVRSRMTQPGSDELRRWIRHKVDVRLKVFFGEGKSGQSAFGRANNLSHGGLGAYIPCAIPIGATVILEVTFPYSPAEVKIKALVR